MSETVEAGFVQSVQELDELAPGKMLVLENGDEWHKTRDGLWLSENGDLWPASRLAAGPGFWAVLFNPDTPAVVVGAEHDRAVVARALRDIGQVWDWRVNQGLAFLASTDDVPVLRRLLAGDRLADVPGFEWVAGDGHVERMTPAAIMAEFRDGDERGWDVEFAWLREHHREQLDAITETARVDGIRKPVELGVDGRLWDGHHRLCVAVDLELSDLPVDRVGRREV